MKRPMLPGDHQAAVQRALALGRSGDPVVPAGNTGERSQAVKAGWSKPRGLYSPALKRAVDVLMTLRGGRPLQGGGGSRALQRQEPPAEKSVNRFAMKVASNGGMHQQTN